MRTDGRDERRQVEPSFDDVETSDGRVVEPYTLEGYFDSGGNYIPGWYDEDGVYHLGYGYFDDGGTWQVVYGYYDPDGKWVATEQPVREVGEYRARRADEDSDPESGVAGDTLQVTQLWSDQLLEVETFEVPRTVTVGPEDDENFVADDGLGASFPLVDWDSGRCQLSLTRQMAGAIRRGEHTWTVEEAIEGGVAVPVPGEEDVFEFALDPRSSARLQIGSNTFLVNFIQMPAGVGGGISKLDTDSLPYLTVSAAAHFLFVLLALSLPGQAEARTLDDSRAIDRFVQTDIKPDKEDTEDPSWTENQQEEPTEQSRSRTAGKEGKAGASETADDKSEPTFDGPPEPSDSSETAKERDRRVAMNAGAVGALDDDGVASQFGADAPGVDAEGIAWMDDGDGPGARGAQGLAVDGTGRGGGHVDEEGQSIGDIETEPTTESPPGEPPCTPYPECAKSESAPDEQVNLGPVESGGGLSKEVIQRVVRSHRRELKYCYEQQLQRTPELGGRVAVTFSVSSTGDVISAVVEESSMNNAAVEQCMTRKIRGWTFPAPKGGQLVEVNYPFSFSSGNN